jgi:serine/threonine protein kinase
MKTPDGFINLRPLNAGKKKRVYIGFHVLSRRWMVLKCFLEQPSQEDLAQDLRPLLARLDHPNIVRQESPQKIGTDIWLVEERLDLAFEELAPMENRYQYSLLADDVAQGLKHIHDQPKPIVHGDIHLGNCGVVSGIGKLLDFGRATYEQVGRRRVHGKGFICTRPPEFFDGGVALTRAADVWALGCTLYALRTNEYPFVTSDELLRFYKNGSRKRLEKTIEGRTRKGLADSVAKRHVGKFDAKLWSILRQALEPKVEKRASADVLAAALRRYKNQSEHSLRPAKVTPKRLREFGRRLLAEERVANVTWFAAEVKKST